LGLTALTSSVLYLGQEGYVDVPHRPGLGIEVEEEKVQAGLFPGDWATPQFRLKDDSFAEW
jgi:galactonate dehydratase